MQASGITPVFVKACNMEGFHRAGHIFYIATIIASIHAIYVY